VRSVKIAAIKARQKEALISSDAFKGQSWFYGFVHAIKLTDRKPSFIPPALMAGPNCTKDAFYRSIIRCHEQIQMLRIIRISPYRGDRRPCLCSSGVRSDRGPIMPSVVFEKIGQYLTVSPSNK
jgi:hypothetical protein